MKKKYITPTMVIVEAETQTAMLSGSDPKRTVGFDLGTKYPEKGEAETDGDYDIYAKGYNAWTTWDE